MLGMINMLKRFNIRSILKHVSHVKESSTYSNNLRFKHSKQFKHVKHCNLSNMIQHLKLFTHICLKIYILFTLVKMFGMI